MLEATKSVSPIDTLAYLQAELEDDDSDGTWTDDESIDDDEDLSLENHPNQSESDPNSTESSHKTTLALKPSPAASGSLAMPSGIVVARSTTTELHTSQLNRPIRFNFSPILQSIEEECIEEELKDLLNKVEESLTSTNISGETKFEENETFLSAGTSSPTPIERGNAPVSFTEISPW